MVPVGAIARRYRRTVFGKPLAALTVPNLHAVVSAVTAGSGYSVLPRSLCEEHLVAGRLALLHDPEEPPLNTLFLVQHPGADASPDVIRVREALQQAARTWSPVPCRRVAGRPHARHASSRLSSRTTHPAPSSRRRASSAAYACCLNNCFSASGHGHGFGG